MPQHVQSQSRKCSANCSSFCSHDMIKIDLNSEQLRKANARQLNEFYALENETKRTSARVLWPLLLLFLLIRTGKTRRLACRFVRVCRRIEIVMYVCRHRRARRASRERTDRKQVDYYKKMANKIDSTYRENRDYQIISE
jgi:hypothetical protein